MLAIYAFQEGTLRPATPQNGGLPSGTAWVDLLNPTADEIAETERLTAAPIPSRDEMQEIESSSRLYAEGNALVMTLPVLNKTATAEPEVTAITFILANKRLITVRYADPTPFGLFVHRLKQQPLAMDTGEKMLIGLLEQIADRLADILEAAIGDSDTQSHLVFRPDTACDATPDFQSVLRHIGKCGDIATHTKDSILGLNRLLLFFTAQTHLAKNEKERVEILQHDIASIDEHAHFLSERIGFLLNATLGMVNIDQNNIIKIFSVVAVAFLPPTLIASIYGMNFEIMPELKWAMGYPFVLILMILSAILPFYYFRRKRWL